MSARFATRGLHVYCVVDDALRPEESLEGLEGRPVRSWTAAGLRAWASALDRPPPTEAELLHRHHEVVLAAFAAGGVLPVRFGQWLADEPALLAWLERDAGRLGPALERLAGAAEFGVRFRAPPAAEAAAAPGREAQAAPAPAREHEAAGAAVREAETAGGPAAAERTEARRYLHALARQRAARRDALASRDALVRGLATAAGGLILEHRLLPSAPGDLAAVAHLVDRGRVEPYREAVVAFLEGHAPNGAELTGPWPPWSFVA